MKIVYSSKCLEYGQAGHPESSQRLQSSYEFLKDKYAFVTPVEIDESDILSVHTKEHIEKVKSGSFFDFDTPNYADIYSYALQSASSAVTALNLTLDGETALSLMRPPGHHAGRDFLEGFCYFNNIAIAVAQALKIVEKVAIVDFDCHHGNGTQDIFLGCDEVLYLSLHQSLLYPGTGLYSEKNCLNYPLPAGTDGGTFMKLLTAAFEKLKEFDPDLVAVSAGYDAYKGDPIASLRLEITTFEEIGKLINSLQKPVFSVLEGGYSPQLKECIHQYLIGLETKKD